MSIFIQEQESEVGEPSYSSANVPPSKFPERHFCSVCGYPFKSILNHYKDSMAPAKHRPIEGK